MAIIQAAELGDLGSIPGGGILLQAIPVFSVVNSERGTGGGACETLGILQKWAESKRFSKRVQLLFTQCYRHRAGGDLICTSWRCRSKFQC